MVYPDEQIDDLGRGLSIIQKQKGFKYGTDSVLLAKFMLMNIKRCKHCVDMGTGTGILPLLISREPAVEKLTGIEIQAEYAEMAARSVKMNNLDGRVNILQGDIKDAPGLLGKGSVQAVVSNPPYKKAESGIKNSGDGLTIARHEVLCTLEDVIKNAALILEPGGYFFMVHRPERLADTMELMRKYRLEPKVLRMVQPKLSKQPSMFLVAAVKNAGRNLRVLPTLILMEEDGRNTKELDEIYEY
ncbi:MAG: tRNA1(Val) (adenine(37)-N6)-methyltransferase [Ruminococcaceae bacterium]|nr:tRNA1(Val) (adenine(37)-N6)-methyltransferase [Oscillospiraceae bacterium]